MNSIENRLDLYNRYINNSHMLTPYVQVVINGSCDSIENRLDLYNRYINNSHMLTPYVQVVINGSCEVLRKLDKIHMCLSVIPS